jgi:hypothetical protein
MFIVIAFSARDAHLVEKQAAMIAHLGGCKGHSLLLVAAKSAQDRLPRFLSALSPYFDRTESTVLDVPEEVGYPRVSNHMFRRSLYFLQGLSNKLPIFFMEPDVTPVRTGWAGALETAFNLSGKRFLGVLQAVTFRENGVYYKKDRHMVGAAVYPHDFAFRSKLLSFADQEPWDTYCRYEILPDAAHTDLIQHNWNSRNYRREGGVITCDPAHERGIASPLRPEAVVVHGCKDGSLADVFLKPAPQLTAAMMDATYQTLSSKQAVLATTGRKRGVAMKASPRKQRRKAA